MRIAEKPHDIDAAWMTQALGGEHGILNGARVTDVSFRGVGHGMMSDSFRFDLTYDRSDPALPATVVGKFAAADPTSKATATNYQIYRTEVGFYRDVAPTLLANVPQPYYVGLDEQTDYFTIIMRDLAPARAIDQMAGCSLEDAEAAIREVAKLHGSRWDDPTLADLPWLAHKAKVINQQMIQALPDLFNGFLDRYRDMLEPEYQAYVRRLLPIYPKILTDQNGPQTVQHGDYRLDNLLFDVGGAGNVHILDWGTVAHASGLTDVSYFIGASLNEQQRADHERDLVRIYYDTLSGLPIGDYSWDDCWRDYRRFCFLGISTGIVAPMMVERSDRADRLFLDMVRNYSRQIEVLDSFSFWE
ncbi:MAG: phosphotransferase [Sphingobium sp.]